MTKYDSYTVRREDGEPIASFDRKADAVRKAKQLSKQSLTRLHVTDIKGTIIYETP